MPQFMRHGPIVPERLVQALEDDRVVIFCGAGISMGAGLPDFRGLVAHCYQELGAPLPDRKSEEWLWFDRMLGTLESRFTSDEVRRVVAARLAQAPANLDLHRAILKLAKLNHADGMRLVTTNFDTYFEEAQSGLNFGTHLHSGPILPIPRNDRIASWKSIVYLHGRLAPPPESNQHLVMTSGDFGRAYLTDAWAARFVTKLFADFTVLFLGYSLNDPVLRYMTDAFAAEASVARTTVERNPAYIFVGYTGRTMPDPVAYQDRGLEPIFYKQSYRHRYLRETIIAWADARGDFLSNTRRIMERLGANSPRSLSPGDSENMLWAIRGNHRNTGGGSRIMRTMDNPPVIDWLFELERKEEVELAAWRASADKVRQYGETLPPLPRRDVAPLMPSSDAAESELSEVSRGLVNWLIAHCDKIELVEWVIDRMRIGRRLHRQWRLALRERLNTQPELKLGFAVFWKIVAADGLLQPHGSARYDWFEFQRTIQHGVVAEEWIREELLRLMQPFIQISRSFQHELRQAQGEERNGAELGDTVNSVFSVEIKPYAADRMKNVIDAAGRLPNFDEFLGRNAFRVSDILLRALELLALVGKADINYDMSVFDRPSIEPHSQNRHHKEWTLVFDLLWRAWAHTNQSSPIRSKRLVNYWREMPYLSFRRLVVAAANHSDQFSTAEKAEVLLHG